MSRFVLVAGASLGGWTWSRVVSILRQHGHEAHPVTLTGTGDRAHLVRRDLDLSAWMTDVQAYLEAEDLGDVVLVGHSFAGAVVEGVGGRIPDRLARIVHVDALVPREGQSVFDLLGAEAAKLIEALVEAHDGWSLPWFTDEQLDATYPGHGISPADLQWLRRHLTPQPIATYRERLGRTDPSVPRTFIRCTRSPGEVPVAAREAGWVIRELDAGHWPMVTVPGALAALLEDCAA